MKEHGAVAGDRMRFEFYGERESFGRGVAIYMRRVTVGVSVDVAQPIMFRTLTLDEEAVCRSEPALRLQMHDAQKLMDELWQCGLRPTEGAGSAGSLAATERHLRDMQTIAMGLLGKEGVKVG